MCLPSYKQGIYRTTYCLTNRIALMEGTDSVKCSSRYSSGLPTLLPWSCAVSAVAKPARFVLLQLEHSIL